MRSVVLGLVDGFGETLGAEDGVETDEAFVCGEESDGHRSGEGEGCRVGSVFSPEEITAEADSQHADGSRRERAAEETHGGGG